MNISVIDYGVGNLHSALKALQLYCPETVLTEDPADVEQADGLVLPGVGAFKVGMDGLHARELTEPVRTAAARGVPILGICLGAQLLLGKGFEFGEHEGLGLIPGDVVHFPSLDERVPHMCWNDIAPPEGVSWTGTILDTLGSEPQMYFVHSYIMQPSDASHVLAATAYGGHTFASVVRQDNVYGCQFHPEKSSVAGLKIIENFAQLVASQCAVR